MNAVIDLSEVEEQLKNCKPGDTYEITFVVDAKTDEELTGTASEIEHLGGEEEYESEEPAPKQSSRGSKVPKAILLVSK